MDAIVHSATIHFADKKYSVMGITEILIILFIILIIFTFNKRISPALRLSISVPLSATTLILLTLEKKYLYVIILGSIFLYSIYQISKQLKSRS